MNLDAIISTEKNTIKQVMEPLKNVQNGAITAIITRTKLKRKQE
jgi:hypothetical protein